jgi:nucleoid-associated protein YgaU
MSKRSSRGLLAFLFLAVLGLGAYYFLGPDAAGPDSLLVPEEEISPEGAQSPSLAPQEVPEEPAGAPPEEGETSPELQPREESEAAPSEAPALAEPVEEEPGDPGSAPGTYVVRRGDNLWNIAKKSSIYGRGAGWVKIWRANEGKVPDFDQLPVGVTLRIPRE